MKRFLASRKAVHRMTNVEEFVCTLNVRRIFYTALLVLFVELLRFGTHFLGLGDLFQCDGSLFLLLLTLATVGLILGLYDDLLARPELSRALCLVFWLLLLLGMIPRFVMDVQLWKEAVYFRPMSVILVSVLLIVIPFWARQDIITVFSVFLVLHSIVLCGIHAGVDYALYSTGIILGALLLGDFVQHQSMSMFLRLKQETTLDSLTGILNRKGGIEKMQTMMELSRRYGGMIAVYMIDIDLFKPYNDNYGHLQGDEALRKVAKAIATVFARSTDVVCRYGGEEFAVCALAEGAAEPAGMAVAVCQAVEALHIPVPERRVSEHLTVSIGLTTFSPNKDNRYIDTLTLIDRADRALYQAKDTGRNGVACWVEGGICVPAGPVRRSG